MAITTYTGTISGSTITANFTDPISGLNTQAQAGRKPHFIYYGIEGLDSSTTEMDSTFQLLLDDDYELEAMLLTKDGGVATTVVTAQFDGTVKSDGSFNDSILLEKTWSVSLTASGTGREYASSDYRTTTSQRLWLKKGVPYFMRMTSDNATAQTTTDLMLALISRRRRR